MEIELIEACAGFIMGLHAATVVARCQVSSLLSPRSFFGRALGQEDK